MGVVVSGGGGEDEDGNAGEDEGGALSKDETCCRMRIRCTCLLSP